MDLASVWLAISARMEADTGSGGLYNSSSPLVTAAYCNAASPEATNPYIVVDFASMDADLAFAKDIYEVLVRFNVYVEKRPSAGGDSSLKCSQIIQRVYGDSSAGSAPSFGFHRYTLTGLGSSWTAVPMFHLSTLTSHEQGIWHWILQYRLRIFK